MTDFLNQGPLEDDPRIGRATARLVLAALASAEPEEAAAAYDEAVVGIVACGEGVALVPASAERLQMDGVAFRALDATGLPDRLSMVEFALAWRKYNPAPVTAEFVERTIEWLVSSSMPGDFAP